MSHHSPMLSGYILYIESRLPLKKNNYSESVCYSLYTKLHFPVAAGREYAYLQFLDSLYRLPN